MSFRALKAGDAFDTDVKLQRRYDTEEQLGTPQKLMQWIMQVVGSTNNVPSGGQYDWRAVQTYLKDGIVLCKLINALLKSIGMPTIHYRPKVPSNFVAMANIEVFLSASRQYGVPETSLFQTGDLAEGRKGPLINVINTLNVLGRLANSRGFQPKYDFVLPPKLDAGLAE
jgi:transgelin